MKSVLLYFDKTPHRANFNSGAILCGKRQLPGRKDMMLAVWHFGLLSLYLYLSGCGQHELPGKNDTTLDELHFGLLYLYLYLSGCG